MLRRVFTISIPGPEVLVNYIGDVKLFQQKNRIGKGPLAGLGERPRVTLRRRMVRALVQMGTANYDRWYVLAHSQGSVLALNGLMETQEALPNYLNRAQWDVARAASIDRRSSTPLSEQEAGEMMPFRPAWLEPDDVIDRRVLFAKLAGFLTYGSPLDKFAVLWPAIVPLNRDSEVFRSDFEWINVYDATDPVADALKYFDQPTPRNISYKASGIHLWSHIAYLKFKAGADDRLANVVARWLTSGGRFDPSSPHGWPWPTPELTRWYRVARMIIWGGLGIGLAAALGYWFDEMTRALQSAISWIPLIGGLLDFLVETFSAWMARAIDALGFLPVWPAKSLLCIVGAALVVLAAGLGRRLRHLFE